MKEHPFLTRFAQGRSSLDALSSILGLESAAREKERETKELNGKERNRENGKIWREKDGTEYKEKNGMEGNTRQLNEKEDYRE